MSPGVAGHAGAAADATGATRVANAGRVLTRRQLRRGARRLRTYVREPEPVLEDPRVVFGPEQVRGEARRMKEPPERVSRAREVVSRQPRRERRVDADEHDVQAGREDVPQRSRTRYSTTCQPTNLGGPRIVPAVERPCRCAFWKASDSVHARNAASSRQTVCDA